MHVGDSQNFETAPQGGSTKIIFFGKKSSLDLVLTCFGQKTHFFGLLVCFFSIKKSETNFQ